jgi:hypothetical protein
MLKSNQFSQYIWAIVLVAITSSTAAAALTCPPIKSKLGGVYELRGVMETGSTIILMPDGRFGYNLTVGAYDEVAEGCWRKEKKTVVLVPTRMEVNDGNNKFKRLDLRINSKGHLIRRYQGKDFGQYKRVKKIK